MSTRFKLNYNSPVTLTFSLLCIVIFLIGLVIPLFTYRFFSVHGSMSLLNPLDYWRLVSHVLGHGSWGHLVGNLSYVLLLGPILEEKYGSQNMLWMIFWTALITGIINVMFFSTGLLGASGIVFMFITLISIVDIKKGHIPLTFLLVAVIFIGREVVTIFQSDQTSQLAHIIGGIAGGLFGFVLNEKKV